MHRFLYRVLFILIQTELLPLSIYRMNRTSWENALLENSLPIMRIFVTLVRVLKHHIKYFDDLSDSKLSPWKRHFLAFIPDYKFDKVLRQQKFVCPDRFYNPFGGENYTLWELFLDLRRTFFVHRLHHKWADLKSAAFNHSDYEASMVIYKLRYLSRLLTILRQKEKNWYAPNHRYLFGKYLSGVRRHRNFILRILQMVSHLDTLIITPVARHLCIMEIV